MGTPVDFGLGHILMTLFYLMTFKSPFHQNSHLLRHWELRRQHLNFERTQFIPNSLESSTFPVFTALASPGLTTML